jgi:hypothetical protein
MKIKSKKQNGSSALAPLNGSAAIKPEVKLHMLKAPIQNAVKYLRLIADQCECLDDDSSCNCSNLALWLEGVMTEQPAYAGPQHVKRAQKQMRQNRALSNAPSAGRGKT